MIIAIIITFFLSLILFLIGASKKSRYMEKIIYLESVVRDWHISEANYIFIRDAFDEIERNNQDRQRTRELYDLFIIKYQKFKKAEIIKSVAKEVKLEEAEV
jgi:hypothetical protein